MPRYSPHGPASSSIFPLGPREVVGGAGCMTRENNGGSCYTLSGEYWLQLVLLDDDQHSVYLYQEQDKDDITATTVSYTHLTLPTKA